jgi:hypothetical protein
MLRFSSGNTSGRSVASTVAPSRPQANPAKPVKPSISFVAPVILHHFKFDFIHFFFLSLYHSLNLSSSLVLLSDLFPNRAPAHIYVEGIPVERNLRIQKSELRRWKRSIAG